MAGGKYLEIEISGSAEFPEEVATLLSEFQAKFNLDMLSFTAWCITEQCRSILNNASVMKTGLTSKSEGEEYQYNKEDKIYIQEIHSMVRDLVSGFSSNAKFQMQKTGFEPVADMLAAAVNNGDESVMDTIVKSLPSTAQKGGKPKLNLASILEKNKAMSGNKSGGES